MAATEPAPLAGRTALVTGGSRGIGLAIALALARNGASVSLVGRDPGALDEAVATVEAAGATAAPISADLGEPGACEATLARHLERFGRVDVLVNNAAGRPARKPVLELSRDEFERLFDINVTAYFLLSRGAAADMRGRGWGRIVNVSSTTGLKARPGMGDYAITKAAEIMLTRQLAVELGGDGITVNAIAPTLTRTGFSRWQWESEAETEKVLRALAIKRTAEPEEVAALAAFLASDAAAMITGTTIPVDGGGSA